MREQGGCLPFCTIPGPSAGEAGQTDGACDREGKAAGTYLHGIFDNSEFTLGVVNNLRSRKGLKELETGGTDYQDFKRKEYDRLAKLIRDNLDMKKVYEIINS